MILNWLVILLFYSTSIPLEIGEHDLHLSKTEIEYNAENESVEIIMHLFIDDVEDAISRYDTTKLNLCTSQEIIEADQFIDDYIQKNFKITSNGIPLKWNFIGKETSEDLFAIWCYLEIEHAELSNDLIVEVTLFNELYEDQKNVVKIEYDKDHKDYFLLDRDKTIGSISIQ